MIRISAESIMPKLPSVVCAGFVIAISLAAAPASAGRQVHGGEVARFLVGKAFRIDCIDGTTGRGEISEHGVANVSYRRPSDQRDGRDNAVLRVRGVQICLAWKQFGGGGDSCYPVSEEAAGRFRLSTGPLWCDISPKF